MTKTLSDNKLFASEKANVILNLFVNCADHNNVKKHQAGFKGKKTSPLNKTTSYDKC